MKTTRLVFFLNLWVVFFIAYPAFGQSLNGQQNLKTKIISIQDKIGDLTDPTMPFKCKEFVLLRTNISNEIGTQIVALIKGRQLTTLQSEIGVCLLSGLSETNYWKITTSLLSTNTSEEILYNILGMPLRYGPCFANAYSNEQYKPILAKLRTDTVSKRIQESLDYILSGEAARTYQDYIKHPDRY